MTSCTCRIAQAEWLASHILILVSGSKGEKRLCEFTVCVCVLYTHVYCISHASCLYVFLMYVSCTYLFNLMLKLQYRYMDLQKRNTDIRLVPLNYQKSLHGVKALGIEL